MTISNKSESIHDVPLIFSGITIAKSLIINILGGSQFNRNSPEPFV